MKIKFIILTVIFLLATGFYFYRNHSIPNKQSGNTLTKFSFALDWTPNTNHTGLYVAQNKGYFRGEGLEVDILPYSSSVSPDVLVATGKADAGVGFTEWIIADSAQGSPVISIAGILAHNTSALITLDNPNINRPRDLENRIYGGYGAPLEQAVVGEIIKKDGGKAKINSLSLDIGALKALESKRVDFIWGFLGWEVIQAKREGIKLKTFPVVDYGIADYYTPNIITSQKMIKNKPEVLKKFMRSLSKGYEFAANNPKEAAVILIQTAPKGTFPDEGLVYESQNYLSTKYMDPGKKWGFQEKKMWQEFPRFILDSGSITDGNGQVVKDMDIESLYTNEFL